MFNSQGVRLRLEDRSVGLFVLPLGVRSTPQGIEAIPGWAGLAKVTAMVDGVVSANVLRVLVGNIELRPAVMHLEPGTNPVGRLSLAVTDVNGKPVPLHKHQVRLETESKEVAEVSADGTVRALPGGAGRRSEIWANFDDTVPGNSCSVRVMRYPLPLLPPTEARGRHVSFWYPPLATAPPVGARFEEMVRQYDLLRTLDTAYDRMCDLTRARPFAGAMQHIAVVCEDDVFKCGGMSGNPVKLGFDPLRPSSAVQFADGSPMWGMMIHEMGHAFVAEFAAIERTLWGGPLRSGGAYAEGLATLCTMYVRDAVFKRPDHYGLPAAAVTSLSHPTVVDRHFADEALRSYLDHGADYPARFNPDVLDGMLLLLGEQYGWHIYPRFFSIFLPPEEPLDFTPGSETERATFFIAALSAAARADLRPVLTGWGLPCDGALFERLLPELTWRAAQRD